MDESDPTWRSVSAGLVVMRLVDNWIEDGAVAARVDSWAISGAREAIAQVAETTPVRRILTSVVDIMTSSTAVDLHTLVPRLMAYGQALEYEARYGLAADVYATITAHVHPVQDADLAVASYLRLGFCLRVLTQFDAATAAYEHASAVALESDDLIGVLRGRLGVARVIGSRGNMKDADAILADAIDRAAAEGLDEVRSSALVDRAYIAGMGELHERAIQYSYQALELSKSPRQRDGILNNIATAFRYLGIATAAQDAYLVLAATAQDQYLRWLAEINLLELAAFQGRELQFDRYRRELEPLEFTPDLRVTYLLHVGRGYHALGQPQIAITYLERAIELASQHGLNRVLFEAEAALFEARRVEKLQQRTTTEIAPEVQNVVNAVHDMREFAVMT